MERRTFVRSTTTAAMAAASYDRVLGANDRINLGVIGSGGQGSSDWKIMIGLPDVNPGAVADVYTPNMEKGVALSKGRAKGYKDFRQLLERKDIDAVIVATPDHWHALATVMACEAGKDVYCEKPLSLAIREGRLMVEAARKHKRIVQTGSQQRSGTHYQRAVEFIRAGGLGTVNHVQASLIRNAMPGWGNPANCAPPAELDWNMWLGPAPARPYNPLRCLYHFRWFWDYSGGQMTNFGAHDLDIVRWALDLKGPQSVAAFGGRFSLKDGGETPDVQEVIYQFPNLVVTWSVREMNAAPSGGFAFHGTKGTLTINRRSYKIAGETWTAPDKTKTRQLEDSESPGSEQHAAHIRHFVDCVKNRKTPIADVEEGHLTATMCHLGNLAMRVGRSLKWDAGKEEFIDDAEANNWLSRPYRAPWKLA